MYLLTRLQKNQNLNLLSHWKEFLKNLRRSKRKKVTFVILVGYKYWRWIECIKEEGLEGGKRRLVEEVRNRDTPFTRKRVVQKLPCDRHIWRKQSTKPRPVKILQHVLETLAKVIWLLHFFFILRLWSGCIFGFLDKKWPTFSLPHPSYLLAKRTDRNQVWSMGVVRLSWKEVFQKMLCSLWCRQRESKTLLRASGSGLQRWTCGKRPVKQSKHS